MNMDYPVIETIKQRRSVRTYQNLPLGADDEEKLREYIDTLSNPFGAKVKVSLVHKTLDGKGEKLGTYGVIKGASTFMGLSVAPASRALLGAGFEFEDLVLYATSLGLGTVWLGGTFSRSSFQRAMHIPEGYLFPAISPVGYPAEKRMLERVMRRTVGADKRKPWSELFFAGDFQTPLSEMEADRFATALEMLRLAPSAANAQPWRVLKDGYTFHFFETHKAKASEADLMMKQIDIGIGIFHFFKTLQAQGIKGAFVDGAPDMDDVPADYHYVISFKAE